MHNILLNAVQILISVSEPIRWCVIMMILLYIFRCTYWPKASVIPKKVEVWVWVGKINLQVLGPFLPLSAPWRVKVDGTSVC